MLNFNSHNMSIVIILPEMTHRGPILKNSNNSHLENFDRYCMCQITVAANFLFSSLSTQSYKNTITVTVKYYIFFMMALKYFL